MLNTTFFEEKPTLNAKQKNRQQGTKYFVFDVILEEMTEYWRYTILNSMLALLKKVRVCCCYMVCPSYCLGFFLNHYNSFCISRDVKNLFCSGRSNLVDR